AQCIGTAAAHQLRVTAQHVIRRGKARGRVARAVRGDVALDHAVQLRVLLRLGVVNLLSRSLDRSLNSRGAVRQSARPLRQQRRQPPYLRRLLLAERLQQSKGGWPCYVAARANNLR